MSKIHIYLLALCSHLESRYDGAHEKILQDAAEESGIPKDEIVKWWESHKPKSKTEAA